MRSRGSATVLAMLVGMVGAIPGVLPAQVVQGRVVDFEAGSPLEGARVRLLGTEGVVAESGSNAEGRFRLTAPRAGEWSITARLLGYGDLEPVTVRLTEDEPLSVELRLSVEAIPIDEPVVVVGHRPHVNLAIVQYHRRREWGERTGMGHFLHGEDLSSRGSMRPSDVLRTVPGVHVDRGGLGSGQILRMRGGCVPAVYLDGMHLNRIDWRESLDSYVHTSEIEGIEVYRGAERPDGYIDAEGCGLILVWTRMASTDAEAAMSWKRIAIGLGLIAALLFLP